MLRKITIFILCCMAISGSTLMAAFDQEMLLNSRPVAMGGAFVGVADDCNAIPSNPAGIAQIQSLSVLAGYSQLYFNLSYGDISRIFGGAVYPLKDIITVGFYVNRLTVVNYNENFFIASVSKKINENFMFGINLKYLSWDSGAIQLYGKGDTEEDLHGAAVSLDYGMLFKIRDDMKLGFVYGDINQPDIASGSSTSQEQIPNSFKLGLAYNPEKYLLAVDLIFRGFSFSSGNPDTREILKKVGFEYPILDKTLLLRSGVSSYNFFQGFNGSLGVGYVYGVKYRIDYAFVMPFFTVKNTYGSHYFNIGFQF